MNKIALVESKHLKKDIPKVNVGDVVRVQVKIMEQDKSRIQAFEGVVIRKRGEGIKHTFTVRRISYGEGVERTFLTHSPYVEKVELIKTGKVARAKLYYLRKKVGKKGKIEEKKDEATKETAPSSPEAKANV